MDTSRVTLLIVCSVLGIQNSTSNWNRMTRISMKKRSTFQRGELLVGLVVGAALSWTVNVLLPGCAGSGVFP